MLQGFSIMNCKTHAIMISQTGPYNGSLPTPAASAGSILQNPKLVTLQDLTLSNNKQKDSDPDADADDVYAATSAAVYIRYGWASFHNVTFTGNSAREDGAGIGAFDAGVIISSCTFRGNTAGMRGGSLAAYRTQVLVKKSKFSGDSSDAGGCLWLSRSSLYVHNSRFTACKATARGGAIHAANLNRVGMSDTVVEKCSGGYGGGVYVSDTPQVLLRGCRIGGNTASGPGGGIHLVALEEDSKLFMTDGCQAVNNSATQGGGIWMQSESAKAGLYAQGLLVEGNKVSEGACSFNTHSFSISGSMGVHLASVSG